jgi:hypothetical protein
MLITETLISVITQGININANSGEQLIAVKSEKAKKKLILEPYNIVKKVQLFFLLSYSMVRLLL